MNEAEIRGDGTTLYRNKSRPMQLETIAVLYSHLLSLAATVMQNRMSDHNIIGVGRSIFNLKTTLQLNIQTERFL